MPQPQNPHLEAAVRQMINTQPHYLKPHKHPQVEITAMKLRIEILETWGDAYYVGLCGIALTQTDGVYIQSSAGNKVFCFNF